MRGEREWLQRKTESRVRRRPTERGREREKKGDQEDEKRQSIVGLENEKLGVGKPANRRSLG